MALARMDKLVKKLMSNPVDMDMLSNNFFILMEYISPRKEPQPSYAQFLGGCAAQFVFQFLDLVIETWFKYLILHYYKGLHLFIHN